LAYWLTRYGFEPTLAERSPTLRIGGYIISFWGLGYDIAERMGLFPALAAAGYHIRELRFVNDRGRRVGGFGVDGFRALTGGRYVSLPRGELAKLIYGHSLSAEIHQAIFAIFSARLGRGPRLKPGRGKRGVAAMESSCEFFGLGSSQADSKFLS
jgi:hypothetical protein